MTDSSQPEAHRFASAAGATTQLRRVTYEEVQDLAEAVAAKLLKVFGPDELRRAALVPIPRAGYLVVGLLSYLLDLRPDQLDGRPGADGLVILVDDCALSGLRIQQTMAARTNDSVAVALLLSPPPLREALLESEPRVTAVVSGGDLSVLPKSDAFRDCWHREFGPDRVWIGRVEPVCFPWGEPEGWLQDVRRRRLLPAPRNAPPHVSMKSRAALIGPLQHRPSRRWTLPDDLRWQEQDGIFWLARPDGAVVSLEGSGADAWRHLAGWGCLDVASGELAQLWQIDTDRARADLIRFAEELRELGLILGPGDDDST